LNKRTISSLQVFLQETLFFKEEVVSLTSRPFIQEDEERKNLESKEQASSHLVFFSQVS
jgi:hypothetical protein